jgi:hypothetical protein
LISAGVTWLPCSLASTEDSALPGISRGMKKSRVIAIMPVTM